LEDAASRKEILNVWQQLNSQKLTVLGVNPEKISLLECELLLNYRKIENVSYHPVCQKTGLLLFGDARTAFLVSNNGKVYGNTGRLKLRGHDFHLICLCGPNCGYYAEQSNLSYDIYTQKYLSLCEKIKGYIDKIIYRKPLRDENPILGDKEEDIETFSWKFYKYAQMIKYFYL
jgi:hypothetical protein